MLMVKKRMVLMVMCSNHLKWCNENTATRTTGRGQEIPWVMASLLMEMLSFLRWYRDGDGDGDGGDGDIVMVTSWWWRWDERMRRHLVNRVRWLVGPIMYWIPVRSKRYHTKPCQSNYVLDTGKKLSCPTRGRHATLHLLQKTILEDVQTKLFFRGCRPRDLFHWSGYG